MIDDPTAPSDYDLIRLGGMLGIAAACVGLAIFMLGCFGFEAYFLAFFPLVAAAAGFVITIVGGVFNHGGVEHTSVVAGLFVNLFGLIGGLLELALYMHWPIFYRAVAP